MAEEPRRSGRATKGVHTKTASSSPAPQPKPTKPPGKAKASKKSKRTLPDATEEYDEEDDEKIRCICGDDNPRDKRAFIECEACQVWQHNVCMGMPDDDDDLPDHYFCEEDHPEEHGETLAALANGEKIWETRNRIYQSEKKSSAKRKSKGGPPGWLKKDMQPSNDAALLSEEEEGAGNKRKRVDESESIPEQEIKPSVEERSARGARQDKRRKLPSDGAPTDSEADVDTALVDIDKLPADRQKIAAALSKIITDDIQNRAQAATYRIPDGQTARALGDHHAIRIEYALKMNHEGPQNPPYTAQFRTLNANLKKNKVLITRLLDGNLTADELSTMESKDLASEELQKQNALLKEQADRQAVAIPDEGPRYRRTHKGDELIEDENAILAEGTRTAAAQPVRDRTSVVEEGSAIVGIHEGSSSPGQSERKSISRPQTGLDQRRTSSQQFDMADIWAKTAQSPTSATAPKPMQMPPRRRSSVKPETEERGATGGTKVDADVDRMLQDDDDESYSPAEYTDGSSVVWRGKLIQSADGVSPMVNARFIAGRDLTDTVSWNDLLPSQLTIDGRLQIDRAEEYLCSLQWSQTTDVSVLVMTPHDDAEAFDAVFQYFKSRQRYAVVNKDKPQMVKDLYIMPVEKGQPVPSHVDLLIYNQLGDVAKEKCLLATLVVSRTLSTPPAVSTNVPPAVDTGTRAPGANGQQTTLPQHMRASVGPAGSPLNANSATFSPPVGSDPATAFPPNPYGGAVHQSMPSALFQEILGPLQYTPTAQQILQQDPNVSREKLVHLREILESDVQARNDIGALAVKLGM